MADWWEYPTNYSNETEVDGVSKMFMSYPSYLVSGKLGIALLIIIFIVSFTATLAAGSKKAFAVAGWISFIMGVFLASIKGADGAGILAVKWVMLMLVIAIMGTLLGKDESSY